MLKKKLAIIISGVFLVTSFGIGFNFISSNYSVYAKSKGKDKGKQSNLTADVLTSATQSVTTTPSSISTTPAGITYPQHMGKGNGNEKRNGKSNGNGKDGTPKLNGKDRADFVHKRNDKRKAAMSHGNGKGNGNLKEKDKDRDNNDMNDNENEIDD